MMDTLSQTLHRLDAAGFVDDLIAMNGRLRSVMTHDHFRPEDLVVVEVVRFEGISDPDDEAIVFALARSDGTPLATYTVPYGPDMNADDVAVVTHLTLRAPA